MLNFQLNLLLKRTKTLSVRNILYIFALSITALLSNAYASESGCTAKIKPGTDRRIVREPLPYSTEIIFGAQRTQRVMDGPELVTRRGGLIPRIYLYDIKEKCDSMREWDGDPYYFMKWYGN